MKAQLETLGKSDGDTEKNMGNSSLAVSLLLQFLFYELRNRNAIKQWLYEKLSLEFDDLLTKTTTGKFFDAVKVNLTINTIELGHFEINSSLTVYLDCRFKFGITISEHQRHQSRFCENG